MNPNWDVETHVWAQLRPGVVLPAARRVLEVPKMGVAQAHAAKAVLEPAHQIAKVMQPIQAVQAAQAALMNVPVVNPIVAIRLLQVAAVALPVVQACAAENALHPVRAARLHVLALAKARVPVVAMLAALAIAKTIAKEHV